MEQQAFNALAQQHMDMVYRLAFHYLRSPQEADDVTQETFLRLFLRREGFDSGEHARHWLVRVALNECKRLAMSPWRRHTEPLEEYAGTLTWETPEQSALFQAGMDLPRKYRVPLYLYYYEGYAVSEISAMLGRNPSTVQTHLARGREQLKHLFKEEWSDV